MVCDRNRDANCAMTNYVGTKVTDRDHLDCIAPQAILQYVAGVRTYNAILSTTAITVSPKSLGPRASTNAEHSHFAFCMRPNVTIRDRMHLSPTKLLIGCCI